MLTTEAPDYPFFLPPDHINIHKLDFTSISMCRVRVTGFDSTFDNMDAFASTRRSKKRKAAAAADGIDFMDIFRHRRPALPTSDLWVVFMVAVIIAAVLLQASALRLGSLGGSGSMEG